MKEPGELLNGIFSAYGENRGPERVFQEWTAFAGPDLAAHSKVLDIRSGVVVVEADHSGWLQILSMRKELILREIRKAVPSLKIQNLRGILRTDDRADEDTGSVPREEPRNEPSGHPEEGKSRLEELFGRLKKEIHRKNKDTKPSRD